MGGATLALIALIAGVGILVVRNAGRPGSGAPGEEGRTARTWHVAAEAGNRTAPEQLSDSDDRDVSRDNWIHDNTISTRAECVDLKEGTTANLVERNHCTGGLDPEGSAFDSRGNGNTIRNNVATGEASAGVRLGGDTPKDGLDNVVVDNTLTDNKGYGIKIQRQPQREVARNTLSGNHKGSIDPPDE